MGICSSKANRHQYTVEKKPYFRKKKQKWSLLQTFPKDFNITFVSFNPTVVNNQIVLATTHRGYVALHKYNCKANQWTEWLNIETTKQYFKFKLQMIKQPVIAIDSNKCILWILEIENNEMLKFDLKSKREIERISVGSDYLLYVQGDFAKAFIVNGQYHVIGSNRTHWQWNKTNLIFKYLFPEIKSLSYFGIIWIKSKQCLLLFGGADFSSVSETQNVKCAGQDSIYRYSLKSETWGKLPIKLPCCLYDFGYILTDNERYILIFGGYAGYMDNYIGFSNVVYLLDTDTMTFKVSTKKCPVNGCYVAANVKEYSNNTIESNLLIFGYIRQDINDKFKNQFIPHDIVTIIELYFDGIEYVHVINKIKNTHWVIRLDALLQ